MISAVCEKIRYFTETLDKKNVISNSLAVHLFLESHQELTSRIANPPPDDNFFNKMKHTIELHRTHRAALMNIADEHLNLSRWEKLILRMTTIFSTNMELMDTIQKLAGKKLVKEISLVVGNRNN